ncbi:hypothetical protein EJB05_14775, partial [Eragrostis curvula]
MAMPPTEQFLLLSLFLVLLAAGVANVVVETSLPVPTRWPEQFHAVLLTNITESGGRLELIELYYDWPRGRNLNVVRGQLSAAGEPLYNVEWVNGSSYLFDAASCVATWHPVGILPPDWVDDAAYLGRDAVDGFECHVWSYHPFFVTYYEDVATGRPVYWNFAGALRHVLSFETGGVPEVSSPKWQAPAHCFNGGNAAVVGNVAEDGEGTSPM